jgi:hypothetical protein
MYPFLLPLLAADIGTIIGFIVGFIVFVAWLINQIQDAKKQMPKQRGQQPAAPRQAQPRAEGRPPAPAAPVGKQADPLRNQVEEFLRRAGRQKQPANQPQRAPLQAPRPPRRPAANEIELLIDEEPLEAERRTLAEPLRPIGRPTAPLSPQPAGASQRPAEARGLEGRHLSSVAEHVAEHVGASARSLSEQSSQLGRRIILEDEQFDVQLKAKFDHAVGTLASSRAADAGRGAVAPTGETPAAQIADLLTRPEGVRQAIVLNEILRRPSDRW